MFWGGSTLQYKLPKLIRYEDGSRPDRNIIDCSAITLALGSEVFITPNDESSVKEKIKLTDDRPQFTIPKGQFAFLITEEFVSVPVDAMALISFKAKYKFRGLINVSGFHVDPGWDGRLIFSVFNAGPQDIILERGDPFALIWYASLDNSSKGFAKSSSRQDSIGSDLIGSMAGEVYSPFKLRKDIEKLREEVHKVTNTAKLYFLRIMFALFSSILLFTFREDIGEAIKNIFSG